LDFDEKTPKKKKSFAPGRIDSVQSYLKEIGRFLQLQPEKKRVV